MSLYPGRFLKPNRQKKKAYRAGSRPMTVTRRGFDVVGYFTLAPTTESHCLVMTAFAAACSSRVGNTALA
jgi:hypothetical protein